MRYFAPVLLLLLAANAYAASLSQTIQNRYRNIVSLQATCTQILTNAASRQAETRQGKILFKKPCLVRWETQGDNDTELLVVGSKTVWEYFPAEKIVYVRDNGKQVLSSRNMLNLLTGEARLEEDFFLEQQGTEQGLLKIKLTPKEPEPDLVLAWLWWNEKTSLVERLLLVDFFGNGNELRLEQIQLNPDISEQAFEFTPPADVSVETVSTQP